MDFLILSYKKEKDIDFKDTVVTLLLDNLVLCGVVQQL